MIARDFRAPLREGNPGSVKKEGFTKEQTEALKKMLESRWAFGEAGLETGMQKYLKSLLQKAETEEQS